MKRLSIITASLLFSTVSFGQKAELEVPGVFGECIPVYASNSGSLRVHERPDLRSDTKVIRYQSGWVIPYKKREGLTRVLKFGSLTAVMSKELENCKDAPIDGNNQLILGEEVQYLYYTGEGYGYIRVRGAECHVPVHPKLDVFKLNELPEVQAWIKVLFEDGSSPGWLLNDGSQTQLSRMEC